MFTVKKTAVTLLAIASALIIVSCDKRSIKPSDNIVTKNYYFNKISDITAASKYITVYYSQQKHTSVKAEGPSNMVDALHIKSDALNRLIIEIENSDKFDVIYKSQSVKVWITAPYVQRIEAMAGASVIVPDSINIPKSLDIRAYSASSIKLSDVRTSRLSVSAYQQSEISIGNIHATSLKTESYTDAYISIAGKNIDTKKHTTRGYR